MDYFWLLKEFFDATHGVIQDTIQSPKNKIMNEIIINLESLISDSFTYPAIFILGMFHALEPGHGKTLIVAYLSGGSTRFWGSFQLITGLILTHFLLFSALAYLITIGGEHFPAIEFLGPLLIIGLGIYLFYRSFFETRHENEEECSDPAHFHFNDSKFSNPFITGLIAGLIPCPSAIAVILISANQFSQNTFSLYSYIFIYVLGIALTLISIMALFIIFKDRFSAQLDKINPKFNTNLIAAVIIIVIGIFYLLMSLSGVEHSH